jgi:hypothetical protein
MLLGSPTSIAEASVAMLGRGCHAPLARKSGTVRLALCASSTSPIGSPTRRAHRQATALPRLPLGTMKEAGSP